MRLHDVQVNISSADTANRFQNNQQQLTAVTQAQESVNANARNEIKKTQTQQSEQEQNSKEISDEEKRLKRWTKGGGQGRDKKRDETGAEQKPRYLASSGNTIDILA